MVGKELKCCSMKVWVSDEWLTLYRPYKEPENNVLKYNAYYYILIGLWEAMWQLLPLVGKVLMQGSFIGIYWAGEPERTGLQADKKMCVGMFVCDDIAFCHLGRSCTSLRIDSTHCLAWSPGFPAFSAATRKKG